jgi:hypothetical protein
MNATFVYPRSVTGGRTNYMGASSGTLSKPSDVWKVFNPALCRNEEMPRLLILRECVCVEGREARSSSSSSVVIRKSSAGGIGEGREEEKEKDNSAATVLRRGTFDVGSIDYRGQ